MDNIEYKGYIYRPFNDDEEDVVKIFHNVIMIKNGVEIDCNNIPASPYCHIAETTFKMWVDCGMPNKEKLGFNANVYNKDIKNYYDKWLDDRIDEAILGKCR